MQKKKSKFWLFIFSFIPGAGEMYMGFMKMGISLMLGFGLLVMIVGITNLGFLSVFPTVMYVYSFFHAHNLRSLDDERFYGMQDQYLFGMDSLDDIEMVKKKLTGGYRKIVAAILIFIGVVMLWQRVFSLLCDIFGWDNQYLSAVFYFVRDDIPRIIIGIAVIWCGIAMIRGKKVDVVAEGQPEVVNTENFVITDNTLKGEGYYAAADNVESGNGNGSGNNGQPGEFDRSNVDRS